MKGAAWHPRSRASRLERILSIRHLAWIRVDWHILFLAFVLLGCGVTFIAAMDHADSLFDRDEVNLSGHLKKIAFAAPALVFGLLLRPRWVRRNAWLFYALSIVLLLLVPIVGEERNNARRWIPLPIGFDLQPSELAKLGLILMLASTLYRSRMQQIDDYFRPVMWTLLPMGLVVLQPDLGTAMTIVPVATGMLFLAGARLRTIGMGLAGALLAGWLAVQSGLFHDYQLQRVRTWVHAWDAESLIEDRNGPSFHTYHGRVAIGNGGMWGRGFSRGVANEAGHLPERDCDSIFAVIAEEAGFFWTSLLLGTYTALILLLFNAASHIRERFSRLVVGGVGLYFASHFFINVGVNLGLFPMTGLTLPLLSTGGSSLLSTFAALGFALGLSAHHEPSLDEDAFRA